MTANSAEMTALMEGLAALEVQNAALRASASQGEAQGALEKKSCQQQDCSPFSGLSSPSDDPWSYSVDTPPKDVPLGLLPKFVSLANSSNILNVHQGVMLIRKLVAVEEEPPTSEVVEAGVVPILVKCMEQTENTRLQFDASWALSNIASVGSTEDVTCILQTNAVPLWIQHFSSHDPDVVEQAAWGIGNIAGMGYQYRDYCLECGALDPLLNVITGPIADQKLAVMHNSVFALSNLCRFKPCPRLNLVASAIPVALHLTRHPTPEIALDALWTLSQISDGPDGIDAILEVAIPVVIDMISAPDTKCHMPALRTIGNVIDGSGSPQQIHLMVECGLLEKLTSTLFESSDDDVVVVALEILGSVLQVGDKFAEAGQCANAYVDVLKEQGCAAVLENLADNNDVPICELAHQIGSNYFYPFR